MSTLSFKDHFSTQAADYSNYRPEYPAELYAFLASLCKERDLAWDCATGNGQAAVELSNHFSYVMATDASVDQIYYAMDYPRVEYQVSTAENSPCKDLSVDLITVAQALHWFNFDAFFAEAKRVLKSTGILAVWCYELHQINPDVDAIIDQLYSDITGPYWPAERKHIEDQYQNILFPFNELKAPKCSMQKNWSFEHLLGYLNTWSATQRYIKENKKNPIELVQKELKNAWDKHGETQLVNWPMTLRIFSK